MKKLRDTKFSFLIGKTGLDFWQKIWYTYGRGEGI